jgi:four helix bundle protein
MAKSFEDLDCWKSAIELDKVVYNFIIGCAIKNDFTLRNQMLGSVGSIADNIAEGFERGGNKELIQFLYIAKGSCGELRSQFNRCKGRNLITSEEFDKKENECKKVSRMISNFITFLKNSDLKGEKYANPRDLNLEQ